MDFILDCRVKGTSNACVFPFKYRGKIYNECTFVESRNAWCAINVAPYTDVTNKYDLMGDCEEDCPKAGMRSVI